MYRIVLAEPDISVSQRIARAFGQDPRFRVIANCAEAERIARLVAVLKPDMLIISLPLVGATTPNVVQAVMANAVTRIIAYAGNGTTDLQMRQAVERGALDAIWTREGVEGELVGLAAKWCALPKPEARGAGAIPKGTISVQTERAPGILPMRKPMQPRIVAIGASTGGPAALEVLVRAWPPNFPVPIVVAQHLTSGFATELVMWLGSLRSVKVKLAEDQERLQPETMYFAPDGMHVRVSFDDSLSLVKAESEDMTVPSVNHLFHSVAEHYGGAAIGVMLTGMGDDGATGLQAMMARGARTVAQSQETCSVFGMPQAAIKQGGVGVVLPLGDIAHYVHECAVKRGRT